jgi:hypothetical protein
MTSVRELHDAAMQYAQHALIARAKEQAALSRSYAEDAYKHEIQALQMFLQLVDVDDADLEPTRSILHLSAASLAYQAALLEESRDLAQQGLQGQPSHRVRAALQELLADVDFLLNPPTSLEPDQLQLTLVGQAILKSGAIWYDEFHKWLHSMVQSVRLAVQQPTRLSPQAARAALHPIVYPVQPGSAIITVQFQRAPTQQDSLAADDIPVAIGQVVSAIAAINDSNLTAFSQQFPNPQDQRTFLIYLRDLAPDGERVHRMRVRGNGQALVFRRTADEIQTLIDALQPDEHVWVTGIIIRTNKRKRTIVVQSDEDQLKYTFKARSAADHDRYVEEFYGNRVRVAGQWKGDAYEIVDISSP